MSNKNSILISELFELNQKLSLNLWHMVNERDKPSNLSPHVIYPLKRDMTVRISEQEARTLCCSLLNDLSLYYSIETPTEQTYKQSGKKYMSAQTDLTLFSFDGHCYTRIVNVEFKAHNPTKVDICKDIEKLVREEVQGNWFHLLKNTNKGTFPSLFRKFKTSFLEYSQNFCNKKISIVFCFCVLEKQTTYIQHFFYKPTQNRYEEYVTSFFNALNLDTNWHIFTQNFGKVSIKQSDIATRTVDSNVESARKTTVRKPLWECPKFSSNCFDLQASNWKNLDTEHFKELLENVTRPKSDLEKNFDLQAATMLKKWFDFSKMLLPEEAYAVLNNWAFGEGAWYKGKSTAIAASHLWDALFYVRPDKRLTDPKVKGGRNILPERFKLWWPKQQKCQDFDNMS